MTSETGQRARRTGGATLHCAADRLQGSNELEERVNSEVIVSSLAAQPEPSNEVKRKIAAALIVADAEGVEWITIQRIGLMPANAKHECQELIDKFLVASAEVEAWAQEMGLRIVEAFLRPVDDMCSAVFNLDRSASAPCEAQARVRKDWGGDATVAQHQH